MRTVGVTLIVVGAVLAAAAPLFVESKFRSEGSAYTDALLSEINPVPRGGTWTWSPVEGWKEGKADILTRDPAKLAILMKGKPVKLSYWPGVIAGGAAAAVGILVLAITNAGSRRDTAQ